MSRKRNLSREEMIKGDWLPVKKFASKKGVSVQAIYQNESLEFGDWNGITVVRE